MKKFSLLVIYVGWFFYAHTQDTIKLMHYNLLYYGVNTGFCNSTNNNISEKDKHLRKIIKYIQPDIFTVNEISSNQTYHQRILDSVLNIDGVTSYKKSGYTNFAGSNIINMLYYNSGKFTLKSQTHVNTSIRDINIYKLYYNAADLSTTNDTAYISCIVAHLKAGNSSEDQQDRYEMAINLMYYLNTINADNNYILSGDFNVYTGNEAAFQTFINFTNPTIRFNDPINKIGDWNNNSYYAPYHTQSTHIDGGCAAGGGLDDRFDFILVSNKIKNGLQHYRCLPNTYWAVGQDGNHFNKNINNPVNNSVPPEIADALFGMSDHLPVILKLYIDQTNGIPNNHNNPPCININYKNPFTDNLKINIDFKEKTDIYLQILSVFGQVLYQSDYSYNPSGLELLLHLSYLKNGMYFLKLTDNKKQTYVWKIVKV